MQHSCLQQDIWSVSNTCSMPSGAGASGGVGCLLPACPFAWGAACLPLAPGAALKSAQNKQHLQPHTAHALTPNLPVTLAMHSVPTCHAKQAAPALAHP